MFTKVNPVSHPVSDGECDALVSLRISQKSQHVAVDKTDDLARMSSFRETHTSSEIEDTNNALSNRLTGESTSTKRELRFLIVVSSAQILFLC